MEKTVGEQKGTRDAFTAFIRFVVAGGGTSLLASGALLLTAGRAPFAVANAVVTVVTTLLATELHHRFTFRAGAGRAGWRTHAKSALTLLVAYLFTTAAVLTLGVLHPHPGALLGQAVYLAASGLAGIGRFAVLRMMVFARRPDAAAVPAPGGPTGSGRRLHRGKVTVAA